MSTNLDYLHEHQVTIWDEWADENGDLGPIYGSQWRSWPTPDGGEIDQIERLIEGIRNDPDSRRHIVSAWNVADIEQMALPPCHCLFPVLGRGRWTLLPALPAQRRPVPGCAVQHRVLRLLTMMVAQVCGLEAREFVHTFGDVHLYSNHVEQARTQLEREPRALPTMHIDRMPDASSISSSRISDSRTMTPTPTSRPRSRCDDDGFTDCRRVVERGHRP